MVSRPTNWPNGQRNSARRPLPNLLRRASTSVSLAAAGSRDEWLGRLPPHDSPGRVAMVAVFSAQVVDTFREVRVAVAISVINMKGGVGKTTIATLLCKRFARSLNVLAIDLDPQANMSQALMGEQGYRRFLDDRSPSIVEVFNGFQPPGIAPSPTRLEASDVARSVRHNRREKLRIIPSRFDFSDKLRTASKADEQALARFIVDDFDDIDIVFIDCAPTESVLTCAAYHASRYVLVPVRPEYFATIGFPLLQRSLEDFRRSNPTHDIDVLGVAINNGFYHGGNDGGPEKQRAMADIRREAAKHEWRIFHNEILFSRGFPKIMRGDHSYSGNAELFFLVADEIRSVLSEEGHLS